MHDGVAVSHCVGLAQFLMLWSLGAILRSTCVCVCVCVWSRLCWFVYCVLQESETEIKTVTNTESMYSSAKSFEDLPISKELRDVKPCRHI